MRHPPRAFDPRKLLARVLFPAAAAKSQHLDQAGVTKQKCVQVAAPQILGLSNAVTRNTRRVPQAACPLFPAEQWYVSFAPIASFDQWSEGVEWKGRGRGGGIGARRPSHHGSCLGKEESRNRNVNLPADGDICLCSVLQRAD